MTTPQGDVPRTEVENQIINNFTELEDKLAELKDELQSETDESKKQEKNDEIQRLEKELVDIKALIDTHSSLQEQDLESLRTRLESVKTAIQEFRGEVADLAGEIQEEAEGVQETPTTYELLKDSETCSRLLNIISSNPDSFKDLPGETAEKKLEYIFEKIRNSIVLFMKNKLGNSENTEKVITNTIAPAFEWSLMELLKKQGNKTNIGMLEGIDGISWNGITDLFNKVNGFATNFASSYNQFSQWINAVDYLSVHNGVLRNPNQSQVLSNPLKFKEYMNDSRFSAKDFSPYAAISDNIFQIDDSQTFEFGITQGQQQSVLGEIGNIDVVNSPTTTALIANMLDKPEQFLGATAGLQTTANSLLDGINSLNSVTKIFGVDILGEISQSGEKSFAFRILDFVCKLIGITGGLEGIVKRWRMDRMNLTDEKNEDIGEIFKKYKELAGGNVNLNITDENSCKTALNDFVVTNPQNTSSTKGDFLRDSIADKMDVSLISPAVVQQILGDSYLKKETITENGETKENVVVDESKFTETDKLKLAHGHLTIMKTHLENYKDNDLSDFYTNIHSTEDLALCITASLYADKDDVIEGVKAKVFLPENYGSVRLDGTVEAGGNVGTSLSELTPDEKSEMETLVEQSKTPNTINYLDNPTYKKYLNIIEREFNLPKYALECVCKQESQGILYSGNNIIGSNAGAQGLFQFMPGTADQYMQHDKLQEKYGKIFTSRDEFLRNPLASAWAAGILYSEFMYKYNYNFQSSLACYNWGIGHYQNNIGNKNLTSSDLTNLPDETRGYVDAITKDILNHNGRNSDSLSSSEVLLADLGQYSRSNGGSDNFEHNNELLIGPRLLAHNKDEIGGLGNSIMNGFQGLDEKKYFPNMDGVVGKSTETHPRKFHSEDGKSAEDDKLAEKDILDYKNNHPGIQSFMFYFGVNTTDYNKTYNDIEKWGILLKKHDIQPVLCTCVGADTRMGKETNLATLNEKLLSLGKEKNRPVIDFAKSYENGDITLSSDGVHPTPTSYSLMTNTINSLLSQA